MSNVPQLIPYGSYLQQQTPTFMKPPSALATALPIVSTGMQTIGTIANIYGAYKAQEQAEEQAKEEKRRWEAQQKMLQQQAENQIKQQAFTNEQSSGNYAQNYQDRIKNNYGNYFAQNRL